MLDSNGDYAALLDNWYAEYMVNVEYCELGTIGKLNQWEVAMAVTKGSPLKKRMDDALTEIKKSGEFDRLRTTWWRGRCTSASDTHRASLVTFVTIVAILVLSTTSLY